MILLATQFDAGAQAEDKSVENDRRISILPVPALGYSPETGSYVGAVALFVIDWYRDSLTRKSNAKLEFNYTWKNQIILETEWAYFFKHERWYTQGKIHFSDYPDQYSGIGAETPDAFTTFFNSRRSIVEINFLKQLPHAFFLGPKLRYLNYQRVSYEPEAKLFPELTNNTTYGLGLTILKDTRNNLLNATKGVYLELSGSYNQSENNYYKLLTEFRNYRKLSKSTAGALRLYNESNFGTPPFFDYALAGGDQLARGYFYGRFREQNLMSLQSEIRQTIYRRWGIAAFGGASVLYADLSEYNLQHILPNYGGGIRFLIDRKNQVNLRLDYALGAGNQSGFYISFGESF